MNGSLMDFEMAASAGTVPALYVAGGILILLMALAFLAVLWARKNMDSSPPLAGDLTLERIETLWNQGVLSESEFRVMRQIAIGKSLARKEANEIQAVENILPSSLMDTVESPIKEKADAPTKELDPPPGDKNE